jgi:hypothetical protein
MVIKGNDSISQIDNLVNKFNEFIFTLFLLTAEVMWHQNQYHRKMMSDELGEMWKEVAVSLQVFNTIKAFAFRG